MGRTYDWIVIGAGITGSALAYELARQGLKVLVLEKNREPDSATAYSYGGLAYWSGTDAVSRQLSQEGIDIYRQLAEELEQPIEFRDLDLLLRMFVRVRPPGDASQAGHGRLALDRARGNIGSTVVSHGVVGFGRSVMIRADGVGGVGQDASSRSAVQKAPSSLSPTASHVLGSDRRRRNSCASR